MLSIPELQEICNQYEISALDKEIKIIEQSIRSTGINIAILGQFKAGKSTFINNIINENLLPTGILPTTSIVTIIENKEKENIYVIFKNGKRKSINQNEIKLYISEEENPNNKKEIDKVIIYKNLNLDKKIRIVDTPGLGSVFEHNSRETLEWLPETGFAIILISAVNPLSQNDLNLISNITQYSPEIIIVISKIDLIPQKEQYILIEFVKKRLQEHFQRNFKIFASTNKTDSASQILKKLLENRKLNEDLNLISTHKTKSAIRRCLDFLMIKLAGLQKITTEKVKLNNLIFDEKFDKNLIRKEIGLIKKDYENKIRSEIEKYLFDNYKNPLTKELINNFDVYFSKRKGNIQKLKNEYEKWIKKEISKRIKEISLYEINYEKFLKNAVNHLEIYLNAFEMRLRDRIEQVLGIKMDDKHITLEVEKVETPNTAISWAFETKIELLWFIIPMFIFRNTVLNHFRKQIDFEVEKNLYRFTSEITKKLKKSISIVAENVYERISEDLDTINKLTQTENHDIKELKSTIKYLKKFL